MSYVAKQYSEALFGLAFEEQQVDELLSEFKRFNAAIDEDIFKFLNHPKISKQNKKEIIDQSVDNTLLKHFIYVLIDNSRIDLLEDSLSEFEKYVRNQNKVLEVKAFSGKSLTSEQKTKLAESLSKKHNRKIELENIVDKSIVGGIRIEYEGMVLDDTINNYLHGLKANLTK